MTQNPTTKQLREFGYLIGIVFPVLLGWLLPALAGHAFRSWTLWIGIPGLVLAVLAPRLLAWPYRFWMALGHALGSINSHVILGLVFIVAVQPIAFIMKALGHDPLRKKLDSNAKTYRELRSSEHKVNLKKVF